MGIDGFIHIFLGLIRGVSQEHTHTTIHEDIRWLLTEVGMQLTAIVIVLYLAI